MHRLYLCGFFTLCYFYLIYTTNCAKKVSIKIFDLNNFQSSVAIICMQSSVSPGEQRTARSVQGRSAHSIRHCSTVTSPTHPPPPKPTISRAEPNYVLSQCSTALLRRYLIANVAINPVKRLHPKITPPSVISATGSVCFWSADDAIDNFQVVRGC